MIDFNPETFNKMQGDEDSWTSPWTEFYDEGDTQLADLEEGYTPGEGGLGDALAGYGWQAPSDFDAAGIENMSLNELINFFGTDSGLLDEGMELSDQWTDQFIEDYGLCLMSLIWANSKTLPINMRHSNRVLFQGMIHGMVQWTQKQENGEELVAFMRCRKQILKQSMEEIWVILKDN